MWMVVKICIVAVDATIAAATEPISFPFSFATEPSSIYSGIVYQRHPFVAVSSKPWRRTRWMSTRKTSTVTWWVSTAS
jgi:hypothetical protein